MIKIMGLDVSSTCIGISLIGEENKKFKLLKTDTYKPSKKVDLFESLHLTVEHFENLFEELQPDDIAIEEISKYFGKNSSADTIIKLAVYNRALGAAGFKYLKKSPTVMNVNTIRSIIKPKGYKGKLPKENVPEVLEAILGIEFPYVINRKGNISPESYDIADSVAVALAYRASQLAKKK